MQRIQVSKSSCFCDPGPRSRIGDQTPVQVSVNFGNGDLEKLQRWGWSRDDYYANFPEKRPVLPVRPAVLHTDSFPLLLKLTKVPLLL